MATKTDNQKRLDAVEARARKLAEAPVINKTADILEKTSDTVEQTLDITEKHLDNLLVGNNKFRPWVKRGPMAAALLIGVGLAAGAGVMYYRNRSLKKQLKERDELHLKEMQEMHAKYKADGEKLVADYTKLINTMIENDEEGDPSKIVSPAETFERLHGREAAKALREYQGEDVPEPEVLEQVKNKSVRKYGGKVEIVEETHTIIEDNPSPGEFDYDKEVPLRTADRPYIITHEEYYQNETNYEQISLTYYDGDDVVVDERDEPLPDPDTTISEDHLTKFGYGSNDPSIVYIRNEALECDFEVVLNTGKYSELVLGLTHDEPDVIKHSKHPSKRERRKLRRSEG